MTATLPSNTWKMSSGNYYQFEMCVATSRPGRGITSVVRWKLHLVACRVERTLADFKKAGWLPEKLQLH